jgi:predicted MPP superfamily phosphohydrolase
MNAFDGLRVDLMLAGHTHGGQVYVPGLGTPVVPSEYGQKYAAGLVNGPRFPVFVTRGTGMALLPVRFGGPPEIALFELTS